MVKPKPNPIFCNLSRKLIIKTTKRASTRFQMGLNGFWLVISVLAMSAILRCDLLINGLIRIEIG